MIVGLRDGIKLVGISLVCFCAVFVCTFMLNFYTDVQAVEYAVTDAMRPLYDAQLATAQFSSAVSGGFLSVIAAVMLAFYIKLYINANGKRIGILKALGYSDLRIALGFWVFGLSVLVGCALGFAAGFAAVPAVYANLTIDGLPKIPIRFHAWLPFALVVAPVIVLGALSCLFALFAVRKPVMSMLRGSGENRKKKKKKAVKDRPFLLQICLASLGAKKAATFFMAFSCFCFSAMVQMGVSMYDMNSGAMGMMILIIGVVLAVVAMIMAATTLVNGNAKNIAMMRAFGYSDRECTVAVFAAQVPFALIGFGIGTAYQYGLLRIMMDLIFTNVAGMPEYSFDLPLMFIVLAVFVVAYAAVIWWYARKLKRLSVKEIMTEN